MSHVFQLTDEQYRIIKEAAERSGRTPEDLFLAWTLDEETRYRQAHPTYYEMDEWLRHLGVSEEEIEASKERVRREHAMPYDADARGVCAVSARVCGANTVSASKVSRCAAENGQ